MTRDAIKAIVKAKLDEINPLDVGVTILNPQIEAQLDPSAISLLEALPSVLGMPVSATVTPVLENRYRDLSVDLPCPSDFLKVHRLRLTHWLRHISELLPDNHPLVDEQEYQYIKATVRKPFGVLSVKTGATKRITCYPAPDTGVGTIGEFLYVQRPSAAESLDDQMIDMLAWTTASSIYAIHGQMENAKLCTDMVKSIVAAKMSL